MLYYAQNTSNEDIVEEIGEKEGELIRKHRPVLNTQIPKASNWRSWDIKTLNTEEILRLLVNK